MGSKTSQLVKKITGNHLGVLQRPLLLISYRKASLISHSLLDIATVVVLKKLCVCVLVLGALTCQGWRRMPDIFLYCCFIFETELRAHCFAGTCLSLFPKAEVAGMHDHTLLLCVCWGTISVPHACTLTHRAISLSLLLFDYFETCSYFIA